MQEKMKRFLSSIGIEDVSRFDLDFDLVGRNSYDNNKVDMAIRKENPWESTLLDEFQAALANIKYPYSMRFSYAHAPSVYDAIALFSGWYLSLYHGVAPFKLDGVYADTLRVTYESGQEKSGRLIVKDFQGLLKWLNYPFELVEEIAPEKVVIDQEAVAKSLDEAEIPVLDSLEEAASVTDSSYYEDKTPEETHKEELETAESTLIKQMKENYKKMQEARNSKRVFTHGDYKPLSSIEEIFSLGLENVDFSGEIFETAVKMTGRGKSMLTMGVGDSVNAVYVRAFENPKTLTAEKMESFKVGMNVRVRGAIDNDRFNGDRMIIAHYIDALPAKKLREDPESEKRVELHLHTKMSAMDGLAEILDYCKVAKNMGMKAIAVTDHGVVQAFPDAQSAGKATGLKIIYGSELFMFDRVPTYIYNPSQTLLLEATYCVFDFETTGLSARYDKITEFGGVLVEHGMVTKTLDLLIDPGIHIPEKITAKTHITDEMVKGKDKIDAAVKKIAAFMGGAILVSHNASFDVGFLNAAREGLGLAPVANPTIDTLALSHYLFPKAARHNLGALSRNLGLDVYNDDEAHRADFDAGALNEVWQAILPSLTKGNPGLRHCDLANLECADPDIYKHMRAYHVCVLVKNEEGLKDLYRLISESHVTYLAEVPKTPRDLIEKYRANLLVGSACLNGEIFELARTRDKKTLLAAMKFYDYIELQPVENYSYLVSMGELSQEQLSTILRDIVECADEAGKPICATGDCHYVDPEDKIYRDVYIAAKALGGGRHPLNPSRRDKMEIFPNPDQHFRSTREMLDSFMKWLPEAKCREIVVKNTNMIADQIGVVEPVKDDLFTPNANLPDSAEKIRNVCYTNFKARYGDNPDPEVKARLDRELDGIIGNGYAVTYYIAHCIIKKANQDGYLVGSRGSVGSSFAATMADITEVNPLRPHYLCPKCHHFEWSTDPSIKSGFDLPDKKCPECGTKMINDGQNIPFETFLGFKADKVPDIDLNFPGDYQSKAHDYTRVLLGKDNVFRAGTIETVADKTAYGYVRGYFERIGKNPDEVNKAQIAKLASKCTGVKRTTGQHPGGIVVIPKNMSVYDFTAIQHPADDRDSDWLTTHYDFRSMHDEVLKLDLLGHVDPMALRMMSELTGVDIRTIPMNDRKVLSLFSSPKVLGMKDNFLAVETGALALPEFGTNFVRGLLSEAKPKSFNDLLIISGLSHGTNVWNNNAEDLIRNKTTTLQGVIGCRDDIMTYLISMGVPNAVSFSIMEDVRHGKKLKPEFKEVMLAHGVPQYYLDSCEKIHYLFPRAHATAYVIGAVRVAYFKVYYPLEFYATFFTVRCDQWDIKAMIEGEEAIKTELSDLQKRSNNKIDPLKPKEEAILDTLKIALEMVERGYHFENIDLYKSDATAFTVDHANKGLIPPFKVIDGLGDAAALTVLEARKNGSFLSKEDLHDRTKLSESNIEDLTSLGVLKDLGDTNQMSLFEFKF